MVAALLLAGCLLAPQEAAPDSDAGGWQGWSELVLENGIRATLIEAPLAGGQATFTFLPLGLLDDDDGRPQLSHLIEHLAIRSTDPEPALVAEGVLLNGETMAASMRLETLSPPDRWREALARHARWLTAREVAPAILEQERRALAAELDQTVQRGFGHKWALAAWNQVVRHGARHVAVARGLADLTVEEAAEVLEDRLRPGPAVRVVSVGPVAREELEAGVREALGVLPARPWRSSVSTLAPEEVVATGAREATWDLTLWHHMEWYPVPDRTAQDRAAADFLALVLNVRLRQRGAFGQLGAQVVAGADLLTPEGRWVLVSVTAPGEEALDGARAVIDAVMDEMASVPEAHTLLGEMGGEVRRWPDFAALRAQGGEDPRLAWIEAQQAVFLTYAQLNTGLERDELAAAYAALDPAAVEAFASDVLRRDRRSTLRLSPGEP